MSQGLNNEEKEKTMIYSLPLDELSSFTEQNIETLKCFPFNKLEAMVEQMRRKKTEDESARNVQDQEFARLVKKYFTPYEFLRTWFNEEEILLSCSRHMTERDLVQEQAVRCTNAGGIRYYERPESEAEFIRESVEFVPTYDKNGRQYLESDRVKCRVYRVKHQYQGTRHGDVILDLLYSRYPELAQFGFNAYEFNEYAGSLSYEIYPKNHIYTPFRALMKGDIEAIKKRNMEYAKSYNCGIYTPENMKKILESEEGKRFFDVIRNLER